MVVVSEVVKRADLVEIGRKFLALIDGRTTMKSKSGYQKKRLPANELSWMCCMKQRNYDDVATNVTSMCAHYQI